LFYYGNGPAYQTFVVTRQRVEINGITRYRGKIHLLSLGVFFNGCVHNFLYGTVVAQMDDLNTSALEQPSENVDGRVMTVEKGRGCDDTYVMLGRVYFDSVTHFYSFIKNRDQKFTNAFSRNGYLTVCKR